MQMNCLRLKIKKRIVDTLSNRMVSDQIETAAEKQKKNEAKNNPIENAANKGKRPKISHNFLSFTHLTLP